MVKHLCTLLLLLSAGAAAPTPDYDVVVYGSSPAGISAATAAATLGMRVALFEPLPMIGGMGAAGNLALNDGGVDAERTGLARNFSLLNGAYYGLSPGVQCPHPESFVAESSFYTMLHKAGVHTIELNCRLLSAQPGPGAGSGKAAAGGAVGSIRVMCKNTSVTATVFIDASYDGEIMTSLNNIEYTAGREAMAQYNESLAGARIPSFAGVGGPKHINALKEDGSLIKYVSNLSDLTSHGDSDDALMAFQHRLCISGDTDRVPWPKPKGYKEDDFLLLQRALEADPQAHASFFTHMPPSKLPGYPGKKKKFCLCCGVTVASTDQPTLNQGWANASWDRKQEIIADHTYFELGSFYYLSNSLSVPVTVRTLFSQYGLCSDEFQAFDHIPPQLYVRASNRLVGDYVMTQNNIADPQSKPDSIAVGNWAFDQHMTGKYAVPSGATDSGGNPLYEVVLEGNFWPSIRNGSNWYDVPYSVMVPKRGSGANLLVPVCLSSSSVAFSSTRIENMYMSVGTAAGTAAKQLVDGDVSTVQDVDVGKVQAILETVFKQRVHGPPGHNPIPPSPTYFNVSGAGSLEWDGHYLASPGQANVYHSTTSSSFSLYAEGGTWRLAVEGVELFYVAAHTTGNEPPLTSDAWTVANGTAPAPTLSAGPMPSTEI